MHADRRESPGSAISSPPVRRLQTPEHGLLMRNTAQTQSVSVPINVQYVEDLLPRIRPTAVLTTRQFEPFMTQIPKQAVLVASRRSTSVL